MPEENLYSRERLVKKLEQQPNWDIVVIGGGATGLGVALDAVSRGLSVALFEKHDFAKGTSSRSTKLIHGGVRYLAQGDLKLVYSALRERDILRKNASHVVRIQPFVIPCYTAGDIVKYYSGLKLYDILAGSFNFGISGFLNKKKVLERLPNISTKGLKGGVEYFDGQFDDARLAINIAQTAIQRSAILLNYFSVNGIIKDNGKVTGVQVTDGETTRVYSISAKVVINATGVFVDEILKMDEPSAKKLVRPSQGVHVVISKKFLNGKSALMIPKTPDGRVLFAVPWRNYVIVGTTDTPLSHSSTEPVPQATEINFIMETVSRYLKEPPQQKDILSVFAGLRPLAATSENDVQTKELSRDHKLLSGRSGMITITGGKWTTYRKMAEETIDLAIKQAGLNKLESKTKEIELHGCTQSSGSRLAFYGTDEESVNQLMNSDESMKTVLVTGHDYTKAEVVWSVRNEMARTIEDVLGRRLRLLFLDARAAISAAPVVASIMAEEMGWNEEIKKEKLDEFLRIAEHYKLNS